MEIFGRHRDDVVHTLVGDKSFDIVYRAFIF